MRSMDSRTGIRTRAGSRCVTGMIYCASRRCRAGVRSRTGSRCRTGMIYLAD